MSAPWSNGLPTSAEISGVEYRIRSGYMAILDICTAMNDPELSDRDRAEVALRIFYPDLPDIPPERYEEALKYCIWFIDGGSELRPQKKAPRLVDWEHDFPVIVGPVNRVLGTEIRHNGGPEDYGIHWWTFLSAYMEIGDCTFAQVVRVRDRLARGKKLDKADQEWYRQNHDLVNIKSKYTNAEKDLLKEWCGG